MTLLDQPTTTADAAAIPAPADAPRSPIDVAETASAAHPAAAGARRATVHPESMTRYRVSVADHVVGYLEAAGPIWVALAGRHYATAVEVAQHRLFAVALRGLADDA